MTSEQMKYHIERIKSFDLAKREWNARLFLIKSQQEKSDKRTFCAIGYGSIIFLLLLWLVTR